MFSRAVALVLLAFVLPAAAGCDDSTAGTNPAPLKEVRLGYFANLTHAQAVLGVHSGEFGSAVSPAKLTTRVFNAGPSLIEALFAGEIDVGYVGPGPAINAHGKSRGEGIRVISGVAANGVLIVARKDSGIKTFADLKGRKIATPQLANTQDIAAKHFLTSLLKQSDASNVLPVPNAEQAGLMERGAIDAAWAPEPWGSRLIVESGATLVAHEKDLWPDKQFTLALVITTPKFLKTHPEAVEKLLGVHRLWTKRLAAEPDKYLGQLQDALFALTNKKLPAGVFPMAIKNVQFTDDPLEQTLKTMADWTHELGFSREVTKLDGLVDLTILRKLQGLK